MPVTLTVNGHRLAATAGVSLFDAAEQAGVRVPTSCVTQGKCKECVVEVTSGMELLSEPTQFEKHLDVRSSRFRLSCQARVCLLYTSDAADERSSVDLGGRRIIK